MNKKGDLSHHVSLRYKVHLISWPVMIFQHFLLLIGFLTHLRVQFVDSFLQHLNVLLIEALLYFLWKSQSTNVIQWTTLTELWIWVSQGGKLIILNGYFITLKTLHWIFPCDWKEAELCSCLCESSRKVDNAIYLAQRTHVWLVEAFCWAVYRLLWLSKWQHGSYQ